LSRYVVPSLTTMRVDIDELGGRAMRTLLAMTPERALPEPVALVPALIVRQSSCPSTDSS
jgi:LacI family transcriptional regulator